MTSGEHGVLYHDTTTVAVTYLDGPAATRLLAQQPEAMATMRPTDWGKVHRFAQDMREGRWQWRGDSVVVSRSRVVRNGQHRLAAIALSGVQVPVLLVLGVEDSVYDQAPQ